MSAFVMAVRQNKNLRCLICDSNIDMGAMCLCKRSPCDLLFSVRLDGESKSTLTPWSGECVETVARRGRVGVWSSELALTELVNRSSIVIERLAVASAAEASEINVRLGPCDRFSVALAVDTSEISV